MPKTKKKLRILLLYTSVGPFGTGHGGGVEPLFRGLLKNLPARGYSVLGMVGKGSKKEKGLPLYEVGGAFSEYQQSFSYQDKILQRADSFLENAWLEIKKRQSEWDVVLSFSYDHISYYSSLWLETPVFHYVSMPSLNENIDAILKKVSSSKKNFLGGVSKSQVKTFPKGLTFEILGGAVDLSSYTFNDNPEEALGWAGRISKEKGLEDAFFLSQKSKKELRIFGFLQDENYFNGILRKYPKANYKYYGQLSTKKLSQELGKCQALLMTPKWEEAYGLVAIDALASGTPVLGYERGGISEIIKSGKTGFLIPSDDLTVFTEKIRQITKLSRKNCRQEAEARFSFDKFTNRILNWIELESASVTS